MRLGGEGAEAGGLRRFTARDHGAAGAVDEHRGTVAVADLRAALLLLALQQAVEDRVIQWVVTFSRVGRVRARLIGHDQFHLPAVEAVQGIAAGLTVAVEDDEVGVRRGGIEDAALQALVPEHGNGNLEHPEFRLVQTQGQDRKT